MSKEMSVILLGVTVVLVTYSGLPASWRMALLLAAGLALIVIGFLLRAGEAPRAGKSSPHLTFVESLPAQAGTVADPAQNSHDSHKEGITSLN